MAYAPRPLPPQRPGMLTAAAVATMVASLLWICGFSLFWVLIVEGMRAIEGVDGFNGTYHMLNSVHMNLTGGGAWAAYVPSLVAMFLGPMLLIRHPLPRIALTIWGVIAVVWIASWLWGTPAIWAPSALYIGLVILATWTPQVGHWYQFPSSPPVSGFAATPGQDRMAP